METPLCSAEPRPAELLKTAPDQVWSSYTTKDFNQAAFLWCFKKPGGCGVYRAEMIKSTPVLEGGKKTILYFEFKLPLTQDEVAQLIISYLNANCLVEPREFASAQGRLKDIIHAQRI